jgi:hypothetical protein
MTTDSLFTSVFYLNLLDVNLKLFRFDFRTTWGILIYADFEPLVVFIWGYDFLFRSLLGRCATLFH